MKKIMIADDSFIIRVTLKRIFQQNGFEVVGAEFTYIPNDTKEVTDEQREAIDKMVEKLEDFDDVQTVYTNMKPAESAE